MSRLFFSFVTFLFISGCGSGDDDLIIPNVPNIPMPPSQSAAIGLFSSPATETTETNFDDSFVVSETANIPWVGPAVNTPTNVDYIAQAFNIARLADSTVKEKLRMPQQATWDNYSTSKKVIYLINSERSARGMRPFRGIAPELVSSSGLYASELSNNNEFSHKYGTYSNSTDRLAGWASVIAPPKPLPYLPSVGTENATYNSFFIEELISYVEVASSAAIYEHEARAIYNFMYVDKLPTIGAPYIHREILLIKDPATAFVPSGVGMVVDNAEPLLGASLAEGVASGTKRNTLVIHGVDPDTPAWDISNITTAPGLIGPESASDCLSDATFTQSTDGTGTNNSTCE